MTAAYALPYAGIEWRGVAARREALPGLGDDVLLHAGPPYAGPPPAAVRQAAACAIVYEGAAATPEEALALLDAGRFRLLPAQDAGLATPLAQVVSASMPVAVLAGANATAYAPLVEGGAPALRFGSGGLEAVGKLRALADLAARHLAPALRARPVAMRPVIEAGLRGGDECHSRTGAANDALAAALDGLDAATLAAIAASPNFVLPILMAAAKCLLLGRAEGLASAGGNGCEFGIRLHGDAAWTTVPAQPPVGSRLPGCEAIEPLGAIGDSPVIDLCGLGGQALAAAPALLADWGALLPEGHAYRRDAVLDPASGIVDVERVRRAGVAPIVNVAILDRDGARGLIGRGFTIPPLELFGG